MQLGAKAKVNADEARRHAKALRAVVNTLQILSRDHPEETALKACLGIAIEALDEGAPHA